MQSSNNTKIEFDYGGKHYVLEYTAASVKRMERNGVKLSKLDEMFFSAPEILFEGAFYANHPNTEKRLIREIYKSLKKTADDEDPEYDEDGNEVDSLKEILGVMIREAVEEWSNRSGNSSWKVTR
ncbi:MAG: DUF5055 domain-containing protein [Bacteroidales bacterium]|nr:DUF5055 domain-containing protein [Bacteroidales bacterium]